VKEQVYLVISQDGVRRMTKRLPDLARSEVAIRLKITVPDACFRSLVVSADVEIPAERVITPVAEVEILEPEAADAPAA
jgi:hypothetical protein